MSDTTLTKQDRDRLRAPFAASSVKWLPIGGVSSNGVNMMPHLNASLVFERLADVDPCWTHDTTPMLLGRNEADPFGLAHGGPWQCVMLVKGVTRRGIGQLEPGAKVDAKTLKTGYSDAIKRAALEFEIGAYLRALDTVWLPRQQSGQDTFRTKTYQSKERFTGLTKTGKAFLRAHYEAIITHRLFVERYGAAVEYGDIAAGDEDRDDEPFVAEPETVASDTAVDVLVLLARFTGRDTPESAVRAAAASKPFRKLLPGTVASVKQHLGLSAEDAERIRVDAIAAAEGDDAAMLRLTDGLETLAAHASSGESQEAMPV